MSPLAIVYVLIMVIFGLVFLIDCIRFRRQIGRYIGYGIFFGIVLLVVDTAILFVVPGALDLIGIGQVITIDAVAFIRMILFVCMGIYCCTQLGRLDIPLTRAVFARTRLPEGIRTGTYLTSVIVVVGLAAAYSVGLFKITSPTLSETLRELSWEQASMLGAGDKPSVMLFLILVEFALAEEVIFRLGIQNYLAKQFRLGGRKYWVAIVLSTALWSIAHAGILEPEWVKIAQVFPLGIVLGFMFRKFGAECCIATHAIFNVTMMYVGPDLIGG